MENKKVREAKLLNGETARSVLSQKCQRVYWKTFSNKCTFVYSLSRFIEYRITISQRRKTKAIKLFNMSQSHSVFFVVKEALSAPQQSR